MGGTPETPHHDGPLGCWWTPLAPLLGPSPLTCPEDAVVWVFQDPPLHLRMIFLLQQRSTHRAIAADVDNFPF